MSWLTYSLLWYFQLLFIGILFIPITQKLFGKFFYDWGYPFAKTIGILVLSYSIFILSTFHILPFVRESLFLILLLLTVLNLFIAAKEKVDLHTISIIVGEELLFFVAFLFWVIIRGQEPSIHGLEKFMDFGFMNSILRTTYFPPPDMWLAGNSINYYFFGHLTGAVLTRLSGLSSSATYSFILSTIFALGITQTFSLTFNILHSFIQKKTVMSIVGGLVGAFIVHFGGNLHTIYLFTNGYSTEGTPTPFWHILSGFHPEKYWYPNATRFIPFTIHEFPLYSYVVADLHGHVFDIPFVLLTLALLFTLLTRFHTEKQISLSFSSFKKSITENNNFLPHLILVGVMCAVHFMTNAFDGPIYLLLTLSILFILFRFSLSFLVSSAILVVSFCLFILPFSMNFKPFASGIGVNCSPDFLVNYKKIGPFLFEKGNCQLSPWWMLIILWGFFWFNYLFLIPAYFRLRNELSLHRKTIVLYMLLLFSFSTILLIIPEFFYVKDIYPQHFRANTMFKLGYQAFMMMGIASSFTFFFYIVYKKALKKQFIMYTLCFIPLFALIAVYPSFAIPSYYGKIDKVPVIQGDGWIDVTLPEYSDIIHYLNSHVTGQPNILEAQGDSYTDYDIVSAYTGLPTVAGWWVHEWLWRGNPSVVSKLIPDIQNMYQGTDAFQLKQLLSKYKIQYIIVGTNERTKYPNLQENTLLQVSHVVFSSQNGLGKIYLVNE